MNDAPEEPRRDNENKSSFQRASNMLEQLPQTDQEVEALRNAVMTKEGLLLSVFDILRNMPRRVLMVFKLNDLTRFDILIPTKTFDNDRLIPCPTGV
jgi:aarF domain-containing kinase